ncbi:hypothetical protein B0J11DRAFT_430219 [Dendryphion nanum]|uniref:Uncharacterized protein n=1 Tax=Dendryphion nanum TaxID=256645 RepID=A0A9P9E4G7_9PLEO|nr:hypothetical protein B0J11DRAFT_430219 [Dendryphion nanum]
MIKVLFPFHAAAWKASSEPIQQMLQEPDTVRKEELTAIWRDKTQTQLNTISITSALFGGVIATSFSWPVFSRLSPSNSSTVLALWYSALILVLTSIAASAQQSVALTRLGSHPHGLEKIRKLLGKSSSSRNTEPSKLQLVVWQAPLSLLNFSVVVFTIGLAILIWSSVSPAWTGDDIKVSNFAG